MINEDRMIKEFSELVAIDSPSYGEREITDVLKAKLRELGFEVAEDGAAKKIGGTAGNIHAFLPGETEAEPILLLGHTDTVGPARGKRAVLHGDGRITSAGDTVLGGDDLCAVVEILEAVRHLREEGLPHRPVEVVFMAAEEVFGKGAKAYDYEALPIKSKEVYCLDLAGHVGSAALRAPTMIGWKAVLKGRAAHAGFAPETGVNAILAASRAVAKLAPGWVGDDTTMNVGTVSGGIANNVVPETCVVTGEVRSLDDAKARRIIADIRAAFEGNSGDAALDFTTEEHLIAYDVPEGAPVVRRFVRACEKLGLPGELTYTLGGSDNNILALHGITGIVLSCGMREVHSTGEYTEADDLVRGAELVAALLTDAE
jgi:tripeptide aminopeptidase